MQLFFFDDGMILVMGILIFLLLGIAIGSFLSASTWRLHKQDAVKNKQAKNKYSITKGRSMCEHCGHQLAVKDLVPLFSWVSLGGKCRYCSKKLSIEYPLAELATGVLFVLSYLAWEFELTVDYLLFANWMVILCILIVLFIYDLKWLLLPNKLVFPLIFLAVFNTIVLGIADGPEAIKDSLGGLLVIGGVFYLLFHISKGRWIGGGDVKMGIFIGIYLGFSRSILTFILSFNIAAMIIVPLLLLKMVKPKTPIPFGPFLIVATIISSLYGYQIVEWYSDTFLYGLI